MKVEAGVMQLPAKEHLVLLGNPQKLGERQVLPHGLGRNQPCQPDPDLDVWPPQLRYNQVLLFKPPVCGSLLLQP